MSINNKNILANTDLLVKYFSVEQAKIDEEIERRSKNEKHEETKENTIGLDKICAPRTASQR